MRGNAALLNSGGTIAAFAIGRNANATGRSILAPEEQQIA
jgi:hypothetical protein